MKKELRSKLRAVLSATQPATLQKKSQAIAENLFRQPEYRKAEIMMIYLSIHHEVDTTPIVVQAWQDRKKVVAPQVSWESRQMIPVEIRNLNEDISDSRFGIREPIRGMPIPISLIDLVIVSGLGFDPFGNRLGRGRGFYDRFLGRPEFHGVSCGIGMESQIVESIPAGAHDVKLHMLVTDTDVRRFDP